MPQRATGHLIALFTMAVWAFTFICTKVLLRSFAPVEILFIRFALALVVLKCVRPHLLRTKERKHEWLFAGAGLSGVTLYFLLENIALVYTTAINTAIILTAAPLFTAIFATIFKQEKSLDLRFVVGFVIAMAGVVIVSITRESASVTGFRVFANPGDVLALAAAAAWGIYSVLVGKINSLGYETIASTKRIFAWGVLFTLPTLVPLGAQLECSRFLEPLNIASILYLGLLASALCFATWSLAVRHLGPSRASAYIYLSPVLTTVAAVFLLHETLTWLTVLGAVLTLGGLILTEWRGKRGELDQ